jgi:hypothetical protein
LRPNTNLHKLGEAQAKTSKSAALFFTQNDLSTDARRTVGKFGRSAKLWVLIGFAGDLFGPCNWGKFAVRDECFW